MSDVKVVWDGTPAEWEAIFTRSPEIREGLERYIRQAEARNNAALNAAAHATFKPEHAYKASVVVADHTMLAKLVAQSKGARIAGAAHGLPTWD